MRWPPDDADLAYATEGLAGAPPLVEVLDVLLCLLCHRESAVRERAVRAARVHREADGRLDLALADLASHDPSPAVREAAREAFF